MLFLYFVVGHIQPVFYPVDKPKRISGTHEEEPQILQKIAGGVISGRGRACGIGRIV